MNLRKMGREDGRWMELVQLRVVVSVVLDLLGLVTTGLVAWQAGTPEWPRLIPGPLNLPRGAGNFGKIWSACGQHEIRYIK